MDIDIHALKAIEREREIPFGVLVEAIEAALLGATTTPRVLSLIHI